MDLNLLKIMIESACSDGVISDEELEILKGKAAEMGVAEGDLDFLIHCELNKVKSLSGIKSTKVKKEIIQPEASGFITSEPVDTSNQSGFVNQNISQFNQEKFTDVSVLSNQGAMSIVQKAKYLGKWVIIKRIKPEHKDDLTYQELFFKEFENAYHLDHEHIARLLGKGVDEQGAYYYMEYIDGRELTELIGTGGLKNIILVKKISEQILEALSYLHKKQIYHRDLKPANILITYKGDNVKLTDFGLAQADIFEDNLLKVGTPKYASPEQLVKGNSADHRADIYSFGLILLEMLTGQVADNQKAESIDTKLYRIIDRCVQELPQNRYMSCDDIIKELLKEETPVTEIPQWLIGKIKEYCADGLLSANERKILEIEANKINIDKELFKTLLADELEKARIKVEKEKQKEKQQQAIIQKQQKEEIIQKVKPVKKNPQKENSTSFGKIAKIIFFLILIVGGGYLIVRFIVNKNPVDNKTIVVEKYFVNARDLNLRSAPDSKDRSNIIKTYKEGTALIMIEKGQEWSKVRIEDDQNTGYMRTEFLAQELAYNQDSTKNKNGDKNQTVPDNPDAEINYVITNSAPLRSSKIPIGNSNVLKRLPYGTKVIVLDKEVNWIKVQVEEVTGYLHSTNLIDSQSFEKKGNPKI